MSPVEALEKFEMMLVNARREFVEEAIKLPTLTTGEMARIVTLNAAVEAAMASIADEIARQASIHELKP